MLNINKSTDGSKLTVALEGRLDTNTSPDLEASLQESLDGVTELVLDLEKLDYISSAGLRVLLAAHKMMSKQGSMKVVHVNTTVMEIFEITGFLDILTVE
ncbi:MAG: STAS domain-containing protein [Solobacterium sp.]|nr:STAS domain-containing protein [Solobacterium sp.]